jgi:hypothetical protein
MDAKTRRLNEKGVAEGKARAAAMREQTSPEVLHRVAELRMLVRGAPGLPSLLERTFVGPETEEGSGRQPMLTLSPAQFFRWQGPI